MEGDGATVTAWLEAGELRAVSSTLHQAPDVVAKTVPLLAMAMGSRWGRQPHGPVGKTLMQTQGLDEQTLTWRILFTSLFSGYRLHRPLPLYLEKSGDAEGHKNSHLLTVLIVLIPCVSKSLWEGNFPRPWS